MSSVNRVTIIGNLGNDPDIRTMQSGDKVANLSVATSESWKDKTTGEKKERSEWHKIIVFNQASVKFCENYLSKGDKVYIEGQLETRSYDKDGEKRYVTEIVLRPYKGDLQKLSANTDKPQSAHDEAKSNGYQPDVIAGMVKNQNQPNALDDPEDIIPF